MRLLALDLATIAGWCAGAIGERPASGVVRLPSTGDDVGRFLEAYEEWIGAALTLHAPDRLIFEAPILARQTTKGTVIKLMSLAGLTELVARKAGVRCQEANLSSVKKFWTGYGRAEKADMLRAAEQRGFAPADHNEADAIAAWHYAAHCIDPKLAARAEPVLRVHA